ncbi:cell separation during budding [Podila minutissima]|uniref:Cell separation during budding n=1 Tax=Podila minutissima TaxID=64525 RepID=A0A9P5VGQ6_9FUNG|nr:cell separation during budding [Podila minutissima]
MDGSNPHREGLTTLHHDWTMIPAGKLVERQTPVLLSNGISAAPVFDEAKNSFTGMFDYGDLMAYILILLKKMDPPQDQTLEMRDLIQKANNSQSVPLGEFPKLQAVMQTTLHACGLDHSNVLSVNGNAPVLDALVKMSSNSVSSLAVLDDQGILLGNISMTDIQHVMKHLKSSWLWISCFQFISKIRLSRGVETGEDQYPVLDVSAGSTFGYTLLKLQATKVHRLWVVQDNGSVAGVVSLTDVFRVLSKLIDN